MPSPVAIPRPSGSISPSLSSTPPSDGLYIPVHKRNGSTGLLYASPKASPLDSRFSPKGLTTNPVNGVIREADKFFLTDQQPITPHSRIYTIEFLLTLRRNADESMKTNMRASCPEAVMNRRMRKGLEFHEHHGREQGQSQQQQQEQHRNVQSPVTSAQPSGSDASTKIAPSRVLPRRNTRSTGRPGERRRQALQIRSSSRATSVETWRGTKVPPVYAPFRPLSTISTR